MLLLIRDLLIGFNIDINYSVNEVSHLNNPLSIYKKDKSQIRNMLHEGAGGPKSWPQSGLRYSVRFLGGSHQMMCLGMCELRSYDGIMSGVRGRLIRKACVPSHPIASHPQVSHAHIHPHRLFPSHSTKSRTWEIHDIAIMSCSGNFIHTSRSPTTYITKKKIIKIIRTIIIYKQKTSFTYRFFVILQITYLLR